MGDEIVFPFSPICIYLSSNPVIQTPVSVGFPWLSKQEMFSFAGRTFLPLRANTHIKNLRQGDSQLSHLIYYTAPTNLFFQLSQVSENWSRNREKVNFIMVWLYWVILTPSENAYLSNPYHFTDQILSWKYIVFTSGILRISWLANKCVIYHWLSWWWALMVPAGMIFMISFSSLISRGWSGSIMFLHIYLCGMLVLCNISVYKCGRDASTGLFQCLRQIYLNDWAFGLLLYVPDPLQ